MNDPVSDRDHARAVELARVAFNAAIMDAAKVGIRVEWERVPYRGRASEPMEILDGVRVYRRIRLA